MGRIGCEKGDTRIEEGETKDNDRERKSRGLVRGEGKWDRRGGQARGREQGKSLEMVRERD